MLGLWLYRLLTVPAAPLLRLSLARRAAAGREDKSRLRERFGHAALKRPAGPLVWVHAASVGETNSVLPLIDDILDSRPAQRVLLTTGTLTSATVVARRQSAAPHLRGRLLHQFAPLDHPTWAARFLDHWCPDAAFWVESEIWPNTVLACRRRGLPLVMLNGRLSAKSFAGWQRFPSTARHMLASFDLLMAQDRTTADRLETLGEMPVHVPGNLKFDTPPLSADDAELTALQKALADRPRWLAASTHPGEDELIAEAHENLRDTQAGLLSIIVPRHPERGEEIADKLARRGLAVIRRSSGASPSAETDIYIMDTLGELGLAYRLTDLVVVGGTLVPHGGQNPIEAAQLDCALLHGPHVSNFQEMFDALTARQAVAAIADAPTLAAQLGALLQMPQEAARLATAAKTYADEMTGTRARVMALLVPYLADPAEAAAPPQPREAHDG